MTTENDGARGGYAQLRVGQIREAIDDLSDAAMVLIETPTGYTPVVFIGTEVQVTNTGDLGTGGPLDTDPNTERSKPVLLISTAVVPDA